MRTDDYTPHGYLDLPGHTRRLSPKGVLRSHGVGFRWHFPAYATGYGGRRETYRAGLRVGLDDALALGDFDKVTAPYHSKSLMCFEASRGAARLAAEFFVVGDDVLCAYVHASARLVVRADYTRVIAADHGWGESGLVGRRTATGLVLEGFEDGDAFALEVLGVDHECTVAAAAGGHPTSDGVVTVVGESGEQVTVSGTVTSTSATGASSGVETRVLFARGRTADEAQGRLDDARRRSSVVRAGVLADDEVFWSRAPVLDGDWPDHWRRGLVYDMETVRMMVRAPAGIYTRPWDAMQIQAPRVVLGEAAIDALLLAYADPEAAQELLYGTFADAPMPNVPCSREDGSYNMVSADGSVCGTGPQWGYPWRVVRHLFACRPDRDWLARLYPHLAGYLDWWLANRRDTGGWLVHACSWESGQDLSPRFGQQPLGGGHPTWSTRPVDLQAAFADAAESMAGFATVLGYGHDVDRWNALARDFDQRTRQLWNGTRYADSRGTAARGTDVDDVMLLAPVALGRAAADRKEALRLAIRAFDGDAVVWPMFAWTAVDAATEVGEYATAERIANAVVSRAYGFWDRRDYSDDGRTLPGIACEYWPESGRCGGEGYGWGAFGTHLLLGVLLGIRPTSEGLRIRPNLPVELRVPGRRYAVRLVVRDTVVVVAVHPDRARGAGAGAGATVDVGGRTAWVQWGEDTLWSWETLACARPG
jgi:hypothetical protein